MLMWLLLLCEWLAVGVAMLGCAFALAALVWGVRSIHRRLLR